jgi:signal transduction histidine kinase
MIEQALINLIDNAIKYTDRGYVRISTASDEAHIIISVEDSGIGIPPQDIDRIFERFYVVNKSRTRSIGGTGLGLSIVKHIIERHNGKIEVKSEINKGSTFKILLPHKN